MVKIRIEIDFLGKNEFAAVAEDDLLLADFYSLKEAAGGVSSYGEIVIDNGRGRYDVGGRFTEGGQTPPVRVFCDDVLRYEFFADENGVQEIAGPGARRRLRILLRDGSARLRVTDRARDWLNPVEFVHCVVCDNEHVEKSLVHLIARRAGFRAENIICNDIPFEVLYAKLTRDAWTEISDLARTYRCSVEVMPTFTPLPNPPPQGGRELGASGDEFRAQGAKLVFGNSPYQAGAFEAPRVMSGFAGRDIFLLKTKELGGYYANAVRFKNNMPVQLSKRLIYKNEDAKLSSKSYGDFYCVDDEGDKRAVVYVDDVEGSLNDAVLKGCPIVPDLNRAYFASDKEEIEKRGTLAINISGKYFSDVKLGSGRRQYEDWAERELAERLRPHRRITIETHRANANVRCGELTEVKTESKYFRGMVTGTALHYRKLEALRQRIKIEEC
jgi:hypothetical protein